MSRLDKVIEQVKEIRKGNNRPWIFDDNGNISNNVIIGDVLDILEELKDYEINYLMNILKILKQIVHITHIIIMEIFQMT